MPNVVVVTDQTTDRDFALDPLPRFTVSGTVTSAENGSPIPDVTVRAVGTPVDAVTTNAAGHYSLNLPIGTFTISASADGCTETGSAEITSAADDVTQNFALFRKLDDFGHACAPTAFDWVDANGQTALIGDEIAGRLRLPFSFPFYDGSYDEVFLSENGYINFLQAETGNFIPTGIRPRVHRMRPSTRSGWISSSPTWAASIRSRRQRAEPSLRDRVQPRPGPGLGRPARLRGQALEERHHRPAVRQQPGEPR